MRFLWACLALPLVVEAGPTLAIAPSSLTFAYQVQNVALLVPPQAVVFSSGQTGVFTATRPQQQTWLLLPSGTPAASGNIPGVFQVGVDPTGLSPGTYTSAVSFHTPQGDFAIPVTLFVSAAPVLLSDPAMVLTQSTALGPPLNVAVGLSNGAAALLTTSSTVPWLTAVPGTNSVLVSTTVSKATAGLNSGAIKVTGSTALGIANNPLSIPVIYIVGSLNGGGPLALNPASLSFTGAGSQTVTVAGPAFSASTTTPWLSVGANGQALTVSMNPSGLAAGTYQGTVALTANGVVELLPVTATLAATPTPNLTAVANAASYATGGIAPGEVVALFGANLGPNSLITLMLNDNGFVSSNLSGVQVLFNGTAAPMIYASAGQLAAVAPYDLDGQSSAAVQVVVNGQASNTVNVPVVPTAPGIFTADASGTGSGAILNPDLSVNSPQNPAARGSTVAIYLTGEGQTNPAGVNGQVTTGTSAIPRLAVTATVSGQPATAAFAGEAPSLVSGVMQANVVIPPGVGTGPLPVVVSVGGTPSQSGVTVSVR